MAAALRKVRLVSGYHVLHTRVLGMIMTQLRRGYTVSSHSRPDVVSWSRLIVSVCPLCWSGAASCACGYCQARPRHWSGTGSSGSQHDGVLQGLQRRDRQLHPQHPHAGTTTQGRDGTHTAERGGAEGKGGDHQSCTWPKEKADIYTHMPMCRGCSMRVDGIRVQLREGWGVVTCVASALVHVGGGLQWS